MAGATYWALIEALQAYLEKTGSKSQDTSKSNKQIVDEIEKEVAADIMQKSTTWASFK
jgi:hypothetical protein